jgi:two-component system, OmpR family, sensor histidine kinase CreC
MKIRTRFIIGFLLVVGAGFYYLGGWIIRELRPHYLKAIEESLIDSSTLLASWLSSQTTSDSIDTHHLRKAFSVAEKRTFTARVYDITKKSMLLRVYVTDRNGIVIFDSDSGKDEGRDYSGWNNIFRSLRGNYGARATRHNPKDPNSVVLHVSSPIIHDGKISGILTVAKPADGVAQFIENAQTRIIVTVLLAAFGVLLFSVLLSIWITEPIQRIIGYVRTVRKDTHAPFPRLHLLGVLGRNEMDELGNALIEMRETLEKKKYVEHYIQNLTHEIKSPLTAIGAAADVIDENMPADEQKKFLKNINNEVDRIHHIVERLLELSNIESRTALKSVEKLNLANFITEIVESLNSAIRVKEISIHSILEKELMVSGERFLIRHAIVNLLQNAIDFSSAGSGIEISARNAGKNVEIAIIDEGTGIPEFALPRIFERFYSLSRPDSNNRGTGLGLSFAKEATELHGGSISVQNSRNKRGVTATITLPMVS